MSLRLWGSTVPTNSFLPSSFVALEAASASPSLFPLPFQRFLRLFGTNLLLATFRFWLQPGQRPADAILERVVARQGSTLDVHDNIIR